MGKLEWFFSPCFSCEEWEGGGGVLAERAAGASCSSGSRVSYP